MLSNPKLWEEFFERYYSDRAIPYASELQTSTAESLPFELDVRESLMKFMEMRLYEELITNPDRVIADAEIGLANWISNWVSIDSHRDKIAVRLKNLPSATKVLIKEIRAKHISKLITVEGIVTRATSVAPKIVEAVFECISCGKTYTSQSNGDSVAQPYRCSCGKGKFEVVDSHMVSAQIITLQDYPEMLRGGEIPSNIRVHLERDLTGKIVPGDRVQIVGVMRGDIRRRKNQLSSYVDLFLVANNIEVLQKEYERVQISDEDLRRIRETAARDDLVEVIKRSIAPSIHGYEDIKLALALALFGGVTKQLPSGERVRGDIHVLLLGDPSTAKSAMLRFLHVVASRSIYVSGKGTTDVGLTAAVKKDEFGKWTLEAGALVLADMGVALVDEFDKMSKEDRKAIHTALEQQIIPISKAGINATLMSRCTLIAAANPKFSRFDRYTPVAEQIDLDPAILSRFDLIFTIFDVPSEEIDDRISGHVLTVHTQPADVKPLIDVELLRKYIAYARKNVTPKLSEEAKEELKQFYLSMRRSTKPDSPIPITVRQLEGLIRLSEAAARMRLRDVVTVEDAELAIYLMRKCLEAVAIDPETGMMDIDALTGTPKSRRDAINMIKKIIEDLQDTTPNGAPEKDILDIAESSGVDSKKASEILLKLKLMGEIYCPRYGHYRLINV